MFVIGLGYINFGRYSEASGWNVHTYEVLEETTGILGALVNIETGQRGFLVAGKDGFLEPLIAGKEAFSLHHAQAKKLTSDNLAQQARLDKLMVSYQSWLNDSVEASIKSRLQLEKICRIMGRLLRRSAAARHKWMQCAPLLPNWMAPSEAY